jgi:hypothetical protein
MKSIKLRGGSAYWPQGREHGCLAKIRSPGTAPHLYQGRLVWGGFFAAMRPQGRTLRHPGWISNGVAEWQPFPVKLVKTMEERILNRARCSHVRDTLIPSWTPMVIQTSITLLHHWPQT